MKKIRRDTKGEVYWNDICAALCLGFVIICVAICTALVLAKETQPLTVHITNTSDEALSFELYVNGVYTINGTIEPKDLWEWDCRNGFWGPGETTITVKLPNTLFEKVGYGSQTVSFIFE